jgi:hypothetical protein
MVVVLDDLVLDDLVLGEGTELIVNGRVGLCNSFLSEGSEIFSPEPRFSIL